MISQVNPRKIIPCLFQFQGNHLTLLKAMYKYKQTSRKMKGEEK